MTTPTQQAGWYSDPAGQPMQRWWDGRRWTEHVGAQSDPQLIELQQAQYALQVRNGRAWRAVRIVFWVALTWAILLGLATLAMHATGQG